MNGGAAAIGILLDLLVLGSANPSDLTSVAVTALLDTGATASGIGQRVVSELGLESHGKKLLKSATEERFVDYYMFRIGIDTPPLGSSIAHAVSLPYIFEEVDGFSFGRSADFDVILGMDVIRHCDFELTRGGVCRLSFGA